MPEIWIEMSAFHQKIPLLVFLAIPLVWVALTPIWVAIVGFWWWGVESAWRTFFRD